MKFHKFNFSLKKDNKSEKTTQAVPELDINAPLKVDKSVAFDDEVPSEHINKRWFILGCLVGLVVIVLTSFVLIYLVKNPVVEEKKITISSEISDTDSSTDSASLITTPVFIRSNWSIEVLNGAGIKGAANTAAAKLENLGYKIGKIGNASKSTYAVSEAYIVKELMNEADFLKDLKEQFSISTISGELNDSTASARIIVGKE